MGIEGLDRTSVSSVRAQVLPGVIALNAAAVYATLLLFLMVAGIR